MNMVEEIVKYLPQDENSVVVATRFVDAWQQRYGDSKKCLSVIREMNRHEVIQIMERFINANPAEVVI